MTARIWLGAIAALAACGGSQASDEARAKIADLEHRVAEQQRELESLRALEAQMAELQSEAAHLQELVEAARAAPPPTPAPPATPPAPPQHRFGPDPAVLYAVRVGDSPVEGPANAKVTIIVTSDYACPYCERVVPTLDELRKRYGKDVRVVHKSFVVHTSGAMNATPAARAACAANHQHKWRAMDDLLWSDGFDQRALDDASLEAIAAKAKLALPQYRADIAGRCVREIDAENAAMKKLGLGAIPTMFINGHVLSGAQPIDQWIPLVDDALAKADAAIARGASQDRYYEQEIVGKGTDAAPPSP